MKNYTQVLVGFALGLLVMALWPSSDAPTLGVGAPPVLEREDVQVVVNVASSTRLGGYHDKIFYTPEVAETLTDAEVDAEKEARIQAWIEFLEEQSDDPGPTEEDE